MILADIGMPGEDGYQLVRNLRSSARARLVPIIDRLILACEDFLHQSGIEAPLMVVRGDGALISAAQARLGWWIESRLAPRLYRRARYVAVSEATRRELVGLGVPAIVLELA